MVYHNFLRVYLTFMMIPTSFTKRMFPEDISELFDTIIMQLDNNKKYDDISYNSVLSIIL